MLSDRGIKDAILEGRLGIEPFNQSQLGPCSYDLTIERIVRVKTPDVAEAVSKMGIVRFTDKRCEPYDGCMAPGQFYVGVTKEKVYCELPIDVTTRSSVARLGVETSLSNANFYRSPNHAYLLMRTLGTRCEISEGEKLSQMVIDPNQTANKETVESLVANGRLDIGTDRLSPDL